MKPPLSPEDTQGDRGLRMTPPSGARERYVAAFMLGLALFFPPLLAVFDVPATLLGIPVLFLYLYLAWLVVILVVLLIVLRTRGDEPDDPATGREEDTR
ncbi:hypothetical protein [Ectothiorhodospira lacustris]|uniref:hypothetical protein n=1 Tax=Ectothiorhodospira lacustris TaxID=2899127 RepID=UPI001EE8BBA8|nr:hypothetical protein [Ectothiorhodospira lacustris]MCG5499744.1 hypothetical protein [Ectothiorhodospira lacustris]MCG5509799.1 hypothetical protein [Ectothiorhodospira lacustris]MCG5522287.1 hypothetical protein [Ectothiorhodospira lacustris]